MRPNDVMTSLAWAFRERREAWKIGQNVHTGKSLRLSLIRSPKSATANTARQLSRVQSF